MIAQVPRTDRKFSGSGVIVVRMLAGGTFLDLFKLTFTFFRAGVMTFGGGASVIPILRHEIVTRHGWMSQDEFLDAYTLGSAMPGPIGTNLAAYFGRKVAGWPGALVSLISTVVPTALAMIFLASLYEIYRDHPLVDGALRGIRPVVLALLAVVVWDFLPAALGPREQWLKHPRRWLLILAIFALAVVFNINAAILIVIGGLVGLFFLRA